MYGVVKLYGMLYCVLAVYGMVVIVCKLLYVSVPTYVVFCGVGSSGCVLYDGVWLMCVVVCYRTECVH